MTWAYSMWHRLHSWRNFIIIDRSLRRLLISMKHGLGGFNRLHAIDVGSGARAQQQCSVVPGELMSYVYIF
jgi:hypothetical protein